MAENLNIPKIDLAPIGAALLNGSPKGMYTYFLLSLAKNYFETIISKDATSTENATAALIAFCPNREKRLELLELYIKTRDQYDGNVISASTLCVGELISFLSELLEFEEQSVGGIL